MGCRMRLGMDVNIRTIKLPLNRSVAAGPSLFVACGFVAPKIGKACRGLKPAHKQLCLLSC